MNHKWTLRLGTVVLAAMMYTAALWPFEFIPVCVNPKVQWLPDESAVQIARCGALSTPTPPVSLGRHSFLLGNELTGNRPWRGILYSVSLYDHALSETKVQERFNAVRLNSLDSRWSDPAMITATAPHPQEPGLAGRFIFVQNTGSRVPDRSPSRLIGDLTTARFQSPLKEIFLNDFTVVFSRKDMVANILGFIPLGILVALNFSRPRRPVWMKIYLAPVLIGFGISFSFEFLQQFTYSRNPNVLDIVYNTGGAALGSIAVHIREKIAKR